MLYRRLLTVVGLFILCGIFPSSSADESEEQEEAVHLDGTRDGLIAWPAKGVDGSWASSPSFSVELWWRPERKSRDDHEEQCIVSHGSWQGRFKFSTLPSRNLRFTVRDAKGAVVDCDGSAVLEPRRWMHLAVSWDASTGSAKLLLNGTPDLDLRCNPPQPMHRPGYAGNRGQTFRPARPAPALPLLVGACLEGGGAVERSRGTVSALRLWPAARSESEVQADIFAWRLPPQASTSSSSSGMPGWSSLRRHPPRPHVGAEENRLQTGDLVAVTGERGAMVTASDLHVSVGTLVWSLEGSPRWTAAHCGDQVLSATLTVAELRGAGNSLCSSSSSSSSGGASAMSAPSWCALAPADRSTSRSLASALARRFSIMANEPESWLELHEARERLEGLGHVAADAYAQAWSAAPVDGKIAESKVPFGPTNTSMASKNDRSTTAGFIEHERHSDQLVRIAIVAPSTSKGIPLPEWWDDVDDDNDHGNRDTSGQSSSETARLDRTLRGLPLYGALLKSLHATCEPGFRYTVYVAANENDAILGNTKYVARLFDLAAETFAEPRHANEDSSGSSSTAGVSLGDFPSGQQCEVVQHKLLSLPATIVPSRSLSALFNVPTLAAVAAGEDYVYLANDDLLLVSDQWTTRFVRALQESPLWPNLGVAGGVDTSDTVTPQLEFPFFHRTHVELFSWCGANPWAFKNWFEDNWLTDIYTPFVGAVHYLKDVEVANYGGLMRTAKSSGATDPRYDLGSGGSSNGRTVPSYYLAEVAAGRERIASALRHWGVHDSKLPRDLGYCAPPMKGALPPTLPPMPVGPHQAVLDPCHEKRTAPGHTRPFERPARESRSAPPRAYFSVLNAFGASNPLPAATSSSNVAVVNQTMNAAGFGTGRNFKLADSPASSSTHERHPLEIAVLHHHVPLFSRYGCDKRLTHVVSSLLALGHGVRYGGKHVSDFETDADKARLPAMGVSPVVTPLADGETVKPMVLKRLLTMPSRRHEAKASHSWGGSSISSKSKTSHGHSHQQEQHQVDVVFMTLWFWSTAPVPRDFLPLTRRFAPHAKIVLLSDDVHFHRASLLGNMPWSDVEALRREEVALYRASDAVAVITSEDAARIRSAIAEQTEDSRVSVRVLPVVADLFANKVASGSSESAARLPQATSATSSKIMAETIEDGDYSEDNSLSSWAARAGVVMVGNGANPTNKASVEWFVRDVWPRARDSLVHFLLNTAPGASQSDARKVGATRAAAEVEVDGQVAVTMMSRAEAERLAAFTLIGADWDPALANVPGVEVLGFLNDDALTAALQRARVFVSPICSSTGLNTKNVLALEHGVPLVTTSLGAEGMGFPKKSPSSDGATEEVQAFAIADSADGFATTLGALYTDPGLWYKQRNAGRQHLHDYFSEEAQGRALKELFRDLGLK